MPLPQSYTPAYRTVTVPAQSPITGGGLVVAFASPFRGQIVGVLLAPLDGGAIGGSAATLSLNIGGNPSASVSCAPVAAGVSSGGREMLGTTANVATGDVVKASLGANLTNASSGMLTFIVRLL